MKPGIKNVLKGAAEAVEAGPRRRMRDSRKKLDRFVASLPKMSGSERLIRKDRGR
jgi:hypothetical protein